MCFHQLNGCISIKFHAFPLSSNNLIRTYFEGAENRKSVLSRWNMTLLKSIMEKNEGKLMEECLQLLIRDLRHLQHGLDVQLRTNKFIHKKLINECQDVPARQYACFKPTDWLASRINDLRSSIITFQKANPDNRQMQAFFTDHRYQKQYHPPLSAYTRRDRGDNRGDNQAWIGRKKCFVCNKKGCWSSKYTWDEREEPKKKFKKRFSQRFDNRASQYIAEYERVDYEIDDDIEDIDKAAEALMIDVGFSSPFNLDQENVNTNTLITSFGTIHQAKTMTEYLVNCSFDHTITGVDLTLTPHESDLFTYITSERYTSDEFHGIMIDIGASKWQTAEHGKFLAYKKKIKHVQVDKSQAGAVNVQFGIDSTSSTGSLLLDTSIGIVEIHFVDADISFLLCLEDMDKLNVYFKNLENLLIASTKSVPVVRRFGPPFLLWNESLHSFIANSFINNPCFLTDTELCQLHCRFSHLSEGKLRKVLERAGHKTDKKIIDNLTKYCTHCQKHRKSPGRFKFTLKEYVNSNYSILVDIMYIDGDPILQVVDKANRFQAARWLNNMPAKHK